MTKTPEQLEAEAKALTGTKPLALDELADWLIKGYLESAWDREYMMAAQNLYGEGRDCEHEAALELASGRWLESMRKRYENGEQLVLLDAVSFCAGHSIVMPKWVASEFIGKYKKVTSFEVKTLDDVFGTKTPKNTQLNALRQRYKMSIVVYYCVTDGGFLGTPIDEGLFESVGESVGLTMSTTRRYYYWIKNSPDPVAAAIRSEIDRTLHCWYVDKPKLERVFKPREQT